MTEEVLRAVLEALRQMNYDTSEVTSDTVLGPDGLDLESIAVAELAVRLQDQFGVQFDDEDIEQFIGITLGRFAELVALKVEAVPVAD